MSTANEDLQLIEAAAALLQGAGGRLPITSLMKALFYLDLSSLLETGATVTGATYLALPAGPVVAKYDKRVVQALENAGIAQQDEADDGSKPVCLIAAPTRSNLDERQWHAALRRGAWAATKSAKDLSDYSHQNVGWKLAWQDGLGAKNPAVKIDLAIAMQQMLDRDEWLWATDAETDAAVRGADEEGGECW